MSRDKAQLIIHLALTAAGAVICFFISRPSALVLAAVSLLTLVSGGLFRRARVRRTMKLCDDIDRILRGEEQVFFADYNEGELSVLTSEIHKMILRLREQNYALAADKKFMKESLEDISHQLRTPLTSMLLLLEMLREPELPRSQRMEYTQELTVLLSRMNWLIETLLGLSRIDAGAVNFRSRTITCRELIDAAIEPISVALDLKNITVTADIQGEPSFVGDKQYFTEALLNLLKNCMEHTPEGGRIEIKAQDNPIYTGIIVTDSGEGFAEKDIDHIFERFYRAKGDGGSGYGIGLAFARRIVTAQNGSLQAYNSRSGGACFDMRIYKSTV